MISTRSSLVLPTQKYTTDDGREMLDVFTLRFALSVEDWEYFKNSIMPNLNEVMKHDYADGLLAVLTYGIHKAYEDIEGVPYVYHMDRPKNQS